MTHRDDRSAPRRSGDEGGALILAVIIGMLLVGMASVLVQRTATEAKSADLAAEYQAALHAAEAGVNDYVAKTTEDPQYFLHYVHPGEDTRQRTNGVTVTAGNAWPDETTWTYPNRRQTWRPLGGDTTSLYEYNLAVVPPSVGDPSMVITASGRRRSSPRTVRTIEVQIKGTSLADFQMVSNAFVRYGQSTTTNGKVYGLQNVEFNGTAKADVIAEGTITNPLSPPATYTSVPLARKCDSSGTTGCTVREVVPTQLNFSKFSSALTEVSEASKSTAGGGINLPTDATIDGWRMTFNSAGTITIEKCTRSGGDDLAQTAPVCGSAVTRNVPTIGAIYADQTIIVRGTLKGRVTVVSNDDIVVDANLGYVDATRDVIGLIAENYVYMAQYSPANLTWRGAVLARTGAIKLWDCGGALKDGTMTFTGSQATFLSPCTSAANGSGTTVAGFKIRVFSHDPNLLYLRPPFFPVIEDAYTILKYRELAS